MDNADRYAAAQKVASKDAEIRELQAALVRLKKEKLEAETRTKNGAGKHRDWRLFRIGGTWETLGNKETDLYVIAGLLANPGYVAKLLANDKFQTKSIPEIADHLEKNFDVTKLRDSGFGVLAELHFKRYRQDLRSFLLAYQSDPKLRSGTWKSKPLSRAQRALIMMVVDWKQIPFPLVKNRGDGFDWLQENGGHPVFNLPQEQRKREAQSPTTNTGPSSQQRQV